VWSRDASRGCEEAYVKEDAAKVSSAPFSTLNTDMHLC
jgi:hypothetical protein